MYEIIKRDIMPDGTRIQLEDWHSENTEEYPNLYGYSIGAYPIAKNTGKHGFVRSGDTFRLGISRNEYAKYTDEMVLADYESLVNGNKMLSDLQEHFHYKQRDSYYLGLTDREEN